MTNCRLAIVSLMVVAMSWGCGSGNSDADADLDSDDGGSGDAGVDGAGGSYDAGVTLESPACVWNQAYQENYAADSVGDILASAAGCYVLIDPFESTAARNAIAQMHVASNVVGCYISTGTCEDWRDDYDDMKDYCVSEEWGEWGGEYFVDMPSAGLVTLMKARIDKMATWGCDMIEYDNMDWAFDDAYQSEYGFTAEPADAIAYHQTLCDYTHTKGMGCMAKNTRQGAASFDGGTFESYNDDLNWWETAHLQGFLNDGKLGIIVHYDDNDCDGTYDDYKVTYGNDLSYICEDRSSEKYRHYNED